MLSKIGWLCVKGLFFEFLAFIRLERKIHSALIENLNWRLAKSGPIGKKEKWEIEVKPSEQTDSCSANEANSKDILSIFWECYPQNKHKVHSEWKNRSIFLTPQKWLFWHKLSSMDLRECILAIFGPPGPLAVVRGGRGGSGGVRGTKIFKFFWGHIWVPKC